MIHYKMIKCRCSTSGHLWAAETSHVGTGDLTKTTTGTEFTSTTTSSYYLTGVDVLSRRVDGGVVVLGDSLSDGILAIAPDSELKWSDLVVDRLRHAGSPRLGVANVAVAGNALHPKTDPDSALARFDRDVLDRAGVGTVLVLLGTNDIGAGRTAKDIVKGLRELIKRSHASGVRIIAATIPPLGNASDGSCPEPPDVNPHGEAVRQTVNAHIRPGSPASLRFDGVVDFDAVLRDPVRPSRIQCALSFLGNFHPGAAGHEAMANAVDLDALAPESVRRRASN